MSLSFTQAMQVTSIVSLSLWVKVLYSNLMLGGAKMKAGRRAPEDTYQMSQDKIKPEALAEVDRTQRIVNNDLENVPYGLIMAWGSLICLSRLPTPDSGLYTAHSVLVAVFAGMRVGHTVAYRYALSYTRSLLWISGVLSTIGLGVVAIIASFRI
jgi:uncharacterized MAPEG superfamily protein